jgi:hypothetical protein
MAADGVLATWQSDRYEGFRRSLDSDSPPEVCRSCSVYWGTF